MLSGPSHCIFEAHTAAWCILPRLFIGVLDVSLRLSVWYSVQKVVLPLQLEIKVLRFNFILGLWANPLSRHNLTSKNSNYKSSGKVAEGALLNPSQMVPRYLTFVDYWHHIFSSHWISALSWVRYRIFWKMASLCVLVWIASGNIQCYMLKKLKQ